MTAPTDTDKAVQLKTAIQASTLKIGQGPMWDLQIIADYLAGSDTPRAVQQAFARVAERAVKSDDFPTWSSTDPNLMQAGSWLGDGDQVGLTVQQTWG